MHPRRLVPALIVVVAASALIAVTARPDQPAPPPIVAAPDVSSTTTTEPDFEALVQSGVASTPLAEEEQELTDEALFRSTSTTTTTMPSTTTTTVPSTTTSAAAEAKSGTPTTASPSTTQPPPATTTSTVAPGPQPKAESEFYSRINDYRSSNGQPTLSRDGSLDSYARSWAQRMSEQGSLSHSNIGSLIPPWGSVGENVGVGGSVAVIFDALVGSSGHRANILGDFTHVGIGVCKDASGSLWTVHVFAR
jgi:uncharacterized protein YkwD